MSAESFTSVLHHSKATGTEKLILMAIAWHMSDTWQEGAWPSVQRLAAYANVSERTVTRSIAKLEELGELDVDRHNGRSYGGPKTNRYWVLVSCPDDCQRDSWHRSLEIPEVKFEPVDNLQHTRHL